MNPPRGSRFGHCPVLLEALEPRALLATIAWDAGGDGESVLDPLNWAGDVLPGTSDDAVIGAGAGNLLLSGGVLSVSTIACDAGCSLTVESGAELAVTGDSTFDGQLTLAGGLVSGAGDLTLSDLQWASGTFSGAGEVVLDVGGAAALWTTGTKQLGRTFTQRGSINHTGGSLRFIGGTLVVEAGATYTSNGIAPLTDGGGTNLITNDGVFRKLSSTTLVVDVPFDSTGTLSVVAGIMNLDAGGTNAGARNVAAGATLAYRASYIHAAGSTLAGSGTVNWTGGTQTLSGDWTSATFLNLSNASVDGPGTLSLSGPMSWLSGAMSGSGQVVVNPSGKLALATSGSKLLGRDVVNNGALHWLNGFLSVSDADITNAAGKTFAILSSGNVNVMSGTSAIINAGTVKKMAAGTVTFTEFNGGVTLSNTGMVDVRNGTLSFNGAVLQASGPALAGGTWQVYPSGRLELPGSLISTIGAGTTAMVYGHFSPLDNLALNLGTITIGRGSSAQVGAAGGTFTNLGTINIERGGLLTAASAFTNGSSGVLNFDVGGASSGMWGRLQVSALASLGGTVTFDFINSYSPPAGTVLSFLLSSSSGGTFSTTTIPALPGRVGSVQYLAGGCRLAIS